MELTSFLTCTQTICECIEIWDNLKCNFSTEDYTLKKALEHLAKTGEEKDINKIKDETETALELFARSNDSTKYQQAIISYFKAYCYYFIALCNKELDIDNVSNNFKKGNRELSHLRNLEITLFTDNRNDIKQLQAEGNEFQIQLEKEHTAWKKIYKQIKPQSGLKRFFEKIF